MLFPADLVMPFGPPPQAVLEQRWLWHMLVVLLGVTFFLRVLGVDVAGALLTGLMLGFAMMMTRDGMQEMGKYALVYAVLCGLCFFFDAVPLVTELGGRVSRTTEPMGSHIDEHGTRQAVYTLTTKTIPFFDKKQGLVYNVQSAAMLLSPLCMALGLYLSLAAHNATQRLAGPLFDNEPDDLGFSFSSSAASGELLSRRVHGRIDQPRGGADATRETFERFTGQGHKLSN